MSRIFVLAASKMEVAPLARLLGFSQSNSNSHVGPISAGPNQIEFFITGMGPKRARERAAEVFLDGAGSNAGNTQQLKKPDATIVIGLCGGLTALFPEMTIAAYSSCISSMNGGSPYPCAPELSARINSLLTGQNVPCKSAIGITSPRIATNKDDKLRLAQTGAQVVDMESYEILTRAHKSGIPAAVVRVVADDLDSVLPDFNRALDPDGSMNNRKALQVMLGSPLLTARLFMANKRAAQHLAKALSLVLAADLTPQP